MRFFYDCRGDDVYSTSQLQKSCMALDTTNSEHNQFIRINDNYIPQPDDNLIDFPLYIQASQDAHILLASNNEANNIETGYEIGKEKLDSRINFPIKLYFCLFFV